MTRDKGETKATDRTQEGRASPVLTSPYRAWGAEGGRTTAARRTAEQRKKAARHAHLASAVSAITQRATDLTPTQIELLRAALDGVA